MKSHRVELYQWSPNHSEALQIDWPKVHRTIGIDQTTWLLQQPQDNCQLILEQKDLCCKLVAEFYNQHTLLNYRLMWSHGSTPRLI